jgi:hypothetical protein
MTRFTKMSFVEFGCLQFREMIMGPQSSSTNRLSFKVPGNDIPNWFNHQSVGSSISFWVGPGFPKFALCLGFGMEDNFFNCYVYLSINGRKQKIKHTYFSKLRLTICGFTGVKTHSSGVSMT